MALTPTKLSTRVKHIYDKAPNSVNSHLIEDFHSYTKDNTTSEHHQNNNLKAIIAFAKFLGSETTFYQISTKGQVTKFLDTCSHQALFQVVAQLQNPFRPES